jgi:signal peptidase I
MSSHTATGSGSSIFGPLTGLLTAIFGPMTWDNLKGWIKIIALILIIRWIWFEPFRIPSGSMEPTLHGDPRFFHGDRVAVNKWKYGVRVPFMNKFLFELHDPQRFDIVVFRAVEEDAENKILIKRLMGLPGEEINIRNGKVHVNGEPVEMPPDLDHVEYTQGPTPYPARADRQPNRPRKRAEVLPANISMAFAPRTNTPSSLKTTTCSSATTAPSSRDGRVFGWVPRENLVGPVFCVWWPFGNLRDFTGWSGTWWGMLILYGVPLAVVVYEVGRSFVIASWRLRMNINNAGLEEGDHILIDRLAFGLRAPFSQNRITPGRRPTRGELVAYHAPEDSAFPKAVLVGQVVGFHGDKVRIKGETITVDGEAVGGANPPLPKESDAPVNSRPQWVSQKEPKVPSRHYLIVADADEETLDSRIVGFIPHANLIGPAKSIWWPLRRRRKLTELHSESVS